MNETIGTIITRLRKEHGMTQEQLANALGITFQAVSKWENNISSPDISTLPLLADLFSVSVDSLLGREELPAVRLSEPADPKELPAAPEPDLPAESLPVPSEAPGYDRQSPEGELPWPDDDTFYAVLYHGHELVGYCPGDRDLKPAAKHFAFTWEGDAQNVSSDFSVEVRRKVNGCVSAGENVTCGDVGGSVSAGGSASCGDVSESVNAGTTVSCGDVSGHVKAGGSVKCSDVEGSVAAGGNVNCENVEGSVTAGGHVSCESASGGVRSGFASFGAFSREREADSDGEREYGSGSDFSRSMADFGTELGKRISEITGKAKRFGSSINRRKSDDEE